MPIPYLLPGDLARMPLGVSWKTMGQPGGTSPSPDENQAALLDLCLTATSLADDELNQSVRCSLVSEELYAPSHWASILQNQMARLLTAFNPVVDVPFAATTYASAPYPKTWKVLQPGMVWAERRPTGVYGVSSPSPVGGGLNSILMAGNLVASNLGRYGQQIAVCYSHGWPHADLTATASAGDQTLQVDETAGFVGAAATVRDGANSEDVQVLSVAQPAPAAYSPAYWYNPGNQVTYQGTIYQATLASGPFAPSGVQPPAQGPYWTTTLYPSGPGTLNLAVPLQFAHDPIPVQVTALPPGVRWGAALYAKAVGLERGLGTIAAPGHEGRPASTVEAIEDATVKAVAALRPFARIV